MYKITQKGENKIKIYIRELEAKRKEIIDAGIDTADDTTIPTIEDIIADIEFSGVDWDDILNASCYCNGWGVTDNYDADTALLLVYGQDFYRDVD